MWRRSLLSGKARTNLSLLRVAWRLHCAGRPLSYWMTGCFLGWDGGRAAVESFQSSSSHSGILHFLFLLPPLHVIFFPSHLQIKLTRAPGINGFLGLPPCTHLGPDLWFLTVIANQEDHNEEVVIFWELLKHSLCKECVDFFIFNSKYICVPSLVGVW